MNPLRKLGGTVCSCIFVVGVMVAMGSFWWLVVGFFDVVGYYFFR